MSKDLYWTHEKVRAVAKKCKNRTIFKKKYSGAYKYSIKHGIYNELFKHLGGIKPNGYWTKEKCKEEALRFQTRQEFRKISPTASSKVRKMGWDKELCSHMEKKKTPKDYWTVIKILKEAKNYNTRSEFKNKSSSAYRAALKLGILERVCKHMISTAVIFSNNRTKWIKSACMKEARKYNSLKEFIRSSPVAYGKALEKGWIDEIGSHLTRSGNRYKRGIYIYEFKDKSVYVGLTRNFSGLLTSGPDL